MNTIVTDSPPVTTFELVDPSGVKEPEFEQTALRILKHLVPTCKIFPFHPKVRFNDATWIPDLAVVDEKLTYWFVVEVEIATHHLEKHVLPQVTAFLEGKYEENTAKVLAEALKISEDEARTLIAIIPREVVVVSNKRDEKWNQKLTALGVPHIVIETYRNKTTYQTVQKVEGDLIPSYRSIGFGRVRLNDNSILTQIGTHWKEGPIKISGPNGIAKWQCVIVEGRVWLMKEEGLIEFQDEQIVQFLLRQDDTFIVRLPYC